MLIYIQSKRENNNPPKYRHYAAEGQCVAGGAEGISVER
jgi:hypothetical protein